MDESLRQKWETILNRHPDAAARERAREVLAEAGPSEETQEIAEGVADVSRAPVNLLDRATSSRPAEPEGGILSQLNPIPLLQRADRAVEGLLPEGARAFANKAWDRFTMGYGPRLSDALGTTDRAGREAEYAASPTATALGGGTGLGASALAGPARAVGSGVANALPIASSSLGRLFAALGTGAGTGAAMEAMDAQGMDDPEGIPGRVGHGAAVGAAAGLVGPAAGAARAGVQRLSPWVRRAAQADEAGLMEGARALPRGREGVQRAAEGARDDILAADEAMTAQARENYRAGTEAVLSRPVPMEPIRRRVLDVGVQSRPLSSDRAVSPDAPASPVVQRGQRVLADLRNKPTVEDALQVRRGLDEDAAFGAQAPTPEQLAARQVRGAVREAVRDASPAVAMADDQFANFRRGQERRSDILFRSQDGGRSVQLSDEALEAMPAGMRQAMRVGDEVKAASMLERLGDDSIEALRMQPYLDELASQSPAFAQALERLMAKKALEATRLATLSPQVRTNLSPAVTQLPIVGAAAPYLAQYGRGGLRLLDQSLQLPQQAPPTIPMSLLDAVMGRQEKR